MLVLTSPQPHQVGWWWVGGGGLKGLRCLWAASTHYETFHHQKGFIKCDVASVVLNWRRVVTPLWFTFRTCITIWVKPLCSLFLTEGSFCKAPGSAAQLPAYRPVHVQSECRSITSVYSSHIDVCPHSFRIKGWGGEGRNINMNPKLRIYIFISPPAAGIQLVYVLQFALSSSLHVYSFTIWVWLMCLHRMSLLGIIVL